MCLNLPEMDLKINVDATTTADANPTADATTTASAANKTWIFKRKMVVVSRNRVLEAHWQR